MAGRERNGALGGLAHRRVGQQHERRPEHLALHAQQVRVHVHDQLEVGLDDLPEMGLHRRQSRRDGGLHHRQRHRRHLGLGHWRPVISRLIRSLVSWNRMSTASARS
jgi:hypothetical protein